MKSEKEGPAGLDLGKTFIVGVLVVCVIAMLLLIVVSVLGGTKKSELVPGSYSSSFISAASQIIAPESGITYFNASYYNDTWLSCDGVNDYLLIYPSSNDTFSFWLNDTTPTSWVNIVNNFGLCYINSLQLPCPADYPVYWNGTAYFFCKTDATTFWAGQIDRIEIFDGQLTQSQIDTIWSTGR